MYFHGQTGPPIGTFATRHPHLHRLGPVQLKTADGPRFPPPRGPRHGTHGFRGFESFGKCDQGKKKMAVFRGSQLIALARFGDVQGCQRYLVRAIITCYGRL